MVYKIQPGVLPDIPKVKETFQSVDHNIPMVLNRFPSKKRIKSSRIFNLVMEALIRTCFGFSFKRTKKR